MKKLILFSMLCAWTTLMNATVVNNTAKIDGNIMSLSWGFPIFYNCILFEYELAGAINIIATPSIDNPNDCYLENDSEIFVFFNNKDYRLMPVVNNPCINTGMWPSGIPFNSITTDLDHNPRVSNGNVPNPNPNNNIVDMGAYEVQPQQ